MVEPRQIVKQILDYVGKRGIIAGGAIRDIILEQTPKDYDVFIYKKIWHTEIVEQKGIFDKKPEKVSARDLYGADMRFEVWNTTLQGEAVQIIYCEEYENGDNLGFAFSREHITSDGIVQRFPFTVNMVYATHRGKIVVLPDAKKAFNSRQMIFNKNLGRYPSANYAIPFMYKRVFYLATKIGFTIPWATLKNIDAIGYHIDELDDRGWAKAEEGAFNVSV